MDEIDEVGRSEIVVFLKWLIFLYFELLYMFDIKINEINLI